jgi:hypothetical protein
MESGNSVSDGLDAFALGHALAYAMKEYYS